MNENHARLSPALVETIAGLTAGTISTLTVHPLDVIKTRLQSKPPPPPSSQLPTNLADPLRVHRSSASPTPISGLGILKSLLSSDRPIQSLYRGLAPNLLGNASSWAIFFYIKSIVEGQLLQFHRRHPGSQQQHDDGGGGLSPADYFIASGISGTAITLATNPLWVLKTRMLSSDASAAGAYPSTWQGARRVWAAEGPRGFYRGAGISLLGNSHGAVQFAVYEPLKRFWRTYIRGADQQAGGGGEEKLGNAPTLVISGAAKMVAGTVTYPYQVVRSRLQTYDAEERFGRGIRGVVARVWREDGWRGFYRGLGTNLFKVLPATWVTFLVYENVRYYLPLWAR
ncbi:hypothetical protein M430DRAFT_21914 [Amorphotheca resinae ATCC 22711]|jgi:solute carrier family 25 folate transporter 32|uniref:Mitochondrial carrier protein n=1 Tax=Amorphotheca resinae ATCC 22711 TaxID=857342 RepID=A0A2T3ASU4_AMORE|nr:hypothetical protein M430DRAFT_21914 [Amorphotheca resinae ATCC 22711]PSS10559.1 hypothetical protein M430DRAFT_21914 [Amorphotheca resinae ATCC 22711]